MQCNKRPVRLQATCWQASFLFCCSSSRVLIMQGNSQVVFSVQTVPGWISWHILYEPTNRSLFFHSQGFYSYFSGEYLVSQFSITFPEKISNKKSPPDFQRFSKRMHAWQFKYGVSQIYRRARKLELQMYWKLETFFQFYFHPHSFCWNGLTLSLLTSLHIFPMQNWSNGCIYLKNHQNSNMFSLIILVLCSWPTMNWPWI